MGKIDNKPRPRIPTLKDFTSSDHDNVIDPNSSQEPLRLKTLKKLQNYGIQAESGTPSNIVRTESSPIGYFSENMNYQHGDLEVSVRGNGTEKDISPELKEKEKATRMIGDSTFIASVKPILLGPVRTLEAIQDRHIRKFVHGLKKLSFKEYGKVICDIIFKKIMTATVMFTKLIETQWGFQTFGFLTCLLLLLPTLAASSEVSDECRNAALGTMKIVPECPRSKMDWDTAANQMNCSALVPSQCTTLRYHCVANGFGNAKVEVCAHPKYIQAGRCPEYNERGKKIQHRHNFRQNETKKIYISTDVYDYPQCFDIINNTTKQPPTSDVTKPSQTTVTPAPTTQTTGGIGTDSDSRNGGFTIGIQLGILIPVLSFGVLIGWIYIRKRRPGNSGRGVPRQKMEKDIEASNSDPLLNGTTCNTGTEDNHLIKNGIGNHASNGVGDRLIKHDGSGNKEEELPVDEQGQQMDGAKILH